jgi:hypothetical protein
MFFASETDPKEWFGAYRKLFARVCRVRFLVFSCTTTEACLISTEATPAKSGSTSNITIIYFDVAVLRAGNHLYVISPNSGPFVTVSRRGKGVLLNSNPRQNSRPFHGACTQLNFEDRF